jgi:uncharacterized protein (TIGR03437 family)
MNQHTYSLLSITLLVCLLAGFMRVKTQQPTWNATGTLGMARTRHTATLLANGKVLVVGGLSVPTPCCRVADSAELYDPVAGQWSATGSPSIPRYDHVAVRLANGKVLIVGGNTGAEIYDPDTGTWSAAGSLIAARVYPRAILLTDGRLLVTGGAGGGSTAEVYDPATNAWSSTGTMNAARALHSITLLPNGRVLVAGGGLTANALRTAEIYDPITNGWTLTGELTTPRLNHQATLLANGKVLIAGGADASENVIANVELYDPATGQWSATSNLTTPRVQHTLTLLPNGKVLAAGGAATVSFPFTTLDSAELYDPATGGWTLTVAMGVSRLNHTATLLPNGKVLVAAGATLIGDTRSSAELFDSGTPAVASLSAASFATGPLAPESIVAAFGSNLAASTQMAAGPPLPTQLGGVSVRVRDRTGTERAAPLFFVSPSQINYQTPSGTAQGPAIATVSSGAVGVVEIASVAPGLFSANANGQGVAAAVALRVRADGSQSFEAIARFDSAQSRFVATPIDLSNPAEQVFLLLFGTGFRHRSDLSGVRAQIGGVNVEALFAGAQGDFVGLDQVNLRLPGTLAGRGEVDVVLTVDDKTANTVRLNVK